MSNKYGRMYDCKCCGTCKWHHHEDISDGRVCVNVESRYCTDWTDYDHCCEDWEERRTKHGRT